MDIDGARPDMMPDFRPDFSQPCMRLNFPLLNKPVEIYNEKAL